MQINKNKPQEWGGEYILLCRHCVGEDRCKPYAMYCDVVGKMTATGRIRVRVYGERLNTTKGSKYRYVPVSKVKKYKDYYED